MAWRNPKCVAFTRLDIVAHVPSESAVYGIVDDNVCLYIGETWNLKARLLELANVVAPSHSLQVLFEICPENERPRRQAELTSELVSAERFGEMKTEDSISGLSFWT